jgi:L-aspartate oxidase
MAARAGALLADLEMVQFHPTALALLPAGAPEGSPLALLTEALRGAGALLVDRDGRRFLASVHPEAELAPRDVVARELWRRAQRGEASFLDLRPLTGGVGGLAEHFPAAARACADVGLDPSRDLVPVTPAAHYLIGGVWTDSWGRTSVPGLWACGETAATGAHGANRLASNSLLEALVFGRRVAESVVAAAGQEGGGSGPAPVARAGRAPAERPTGVLRPPRSAPAGAAPVVERRLRARVAEAMWHGAGVVRTEAGLLELLDVLDEAVVELAALERESPTPGRAAGELRNLVEVGRLVAAAALRRCESRGCHLRADHPETRPELAARPRYRATELLEEIRHAAGCASPRVVATG